jgi:hypothetical protein
MPRHLSCDAFVNAASPKREILRILVEDSSSLSVKLLVMRQKYVLVAVVLSLMTFAACKKSNTGGGGTPPSELAGNWNFVSLGVSVTNTVQETVGSVTEKSVTVSNYTTTNNTGLITFSADSMFGKGIGYSVNVNAMGYEYQNGVLLDSVSEPFTFTYPPTNSSAAYKLVGTDSLVYPAGGLVTLPGSAAAQPTGPVGGHLAITGNKLVLTIHFLQVATQQSPGGATATTTVAGVETVNMQKQ